MQKKTSCKILALCPSDALARDLRSRRNCQPDSFSYDDDDSNCDSDSDSDNYRGGASGRGGNGGNGCGGGSGPPNDGKEYSDFIRRREDAVRAGYGHQIQLLLLKFRVVELR